MNLCYGVETKVFYSTEPRHVRRAKALCKNCPMKDACLERGLKFEEHGIWGGTTPEERERIRTKRGITLVDVKNWERRLFDHPRCGENAGYTALKRRRQVDPSIPRCPRCDSAHAQYVYYWKKARRGA
jgi:WhiB family redox-sensing transcriptional regulator